MAAAVVAAATATYRPLPLVRLSTSVESPEPPHPDDASDILGARFVLNTCDPALTLVQLACGNPVLFPEDVTLQWASPESTTPMAAVQDEVAYFADMMLRTWMDVRKSSVVTYPAVVPLRDMLSTPAEFILTCDSADAAWRIWTSHWLPVASSELSSALGAALHRSAQRVPAVIDGCVHDVGSFVAPSPSSSKRSRYRTTAAQQGFGPSTYPAKWNRLRPDRMACFIVDVRLGLQFTLFHRDLATPIYFDAIQATECDFLRQTVAFFQHMCSSSLTLVDGDLRWHTGEMLSLTIATKEPVGFLLRQDVLYHQFYVPGAPGELANQMLQALTCHTHNRYRLQEVSPAVDDSIAGKVTSLRTLTFMDRLQTTPFQAIEYLPMLCPVQPTCWPQLGSSSQKKTATKQQKKSQAASALLDIPIPPLVLSMSSHHRQLREACQGMPYEPIRYRKGRLTDIFMAPFHHALQSSSSAGSRLIAQPSLPLLLIPPPTKGRGSTLQHQQLAVLQWHHRQHTVQTMVQSLVGTTSAAIRYIRHMQTNRVYKVATVVIGSQAAVAAGVAKKSGDDESLLSEDMEDDLFDQ